MNVVSELPSLIYCGTLNSVIDLPLHISSCLLQNYRYNGLQLARCGLPDGALDQLVTELRSAGVRTVNDSSSDWRVAP